MFRRKIYDQLKEWKEADDGRTAVLIEGARRVGKTTAAIEFAKQEYRSHMVIDFSSASDSLMSIFRNHSQNLDVFFQRLQLEFGTVLHERESIIIFDEVQFYPRARQMIKALVKDHRYDYIETGSLISLHQNVKSILIPSEEHSITMHPMDFEEWLWANGDETSAAILREMFTQRTPLGLHAHASMMEKFKTYMVVGGMPQAVDAFLRTNNIMASERAKRDIIGLYEKDIMKLPGKRGKRTGMLFRGIPSLLSSKKKAFAPGTVMEGARSRDFARPMEWVAKSGIAVPCRMCPDPGAAMYLAAVPGRIKLYLLDTGLLVSLASGSGRKELEGTYKALIAGKLSISEGMFFENAVAQQLASLGYDLMFHEFRIGGSQLYEVDFILPGTKGIVPLEAKPSASSRHKSLDLFMEKKRNRVEKAFVIHGKDLRVDGDVVYIPIYMTMFL